MIPKSLTSALSFALCAAALCAAPSRAVAQADPPAPAPVVIVAPKPPAPPPVKAVAGTSVPPGWQKYEVGAPRLFAVALPPKYEVETEMVKLSAKMFAPGFTYAGETGDGTYIAYYMENLPLDAARMPEKYKIDFYEGVWKGLVGGIQQEMEKNGILLKLESGEARAAKVSGLDARDQDFTLGPVSGRARMVLSGSRIFLVLLLEESEKDTSANGLAFLDSLEVYAPPRQ